MAPAKSKRNLLHLGHPDDHIPLFETPEVASAPASRPQLLVALALGLLLAALAWWLGHWSHGVAPPPVHLAWSLPLLLLLASIAAMPFLARHFWERFYGWVAVALAALVAAYYVAAFRQAGAQAIALSLAEYIAFVFLLGTLFVVSGGILIHVRRGASPAVNTALLLVGALLANVLGTTGASMLLIRPYLRINNGHIRPYHVVFFIFIVSNVGGCLTPIGDPPLFMGFLKGVPFLWVAQKCWPMWAFAVGALLAVFFIFDSRAARRQSRQRPAGDDDLGPVVSVYGASNIIFIAVVIAGVFVAPPWREILMVAAAVASLWTTSRRIHHENVFNFAPIREVALLFLGIFATMVPALNYLANNARHATLLDTPGQFYFASGTLSAVLDNAPTYLTFLEAKTGKLDPVSVERLTRIVRNSWDRHPADQSRPASDEHPADQSPPGTSDRINRIIPTPEDLAGLSPDQQRQVEAAVEALRLYHGDQVASGALTADEIRVGLLLGDPPLEAGLIAISLGAVFFGAMTYIGNGPNFMVRTIAEHAGVPCPSFFGYIARYALPILLPILLLVWALFLRT